MVLKATLLTTVYRQARSSRAVPDQKLKDDNEKNLTERSVRKRNGYKTHEEGQEV